jgi:hypothetical protein
MERAIKLGNENKPWYLKDRMLEPLRKEPRFEELIKKIDSDV